MRLIIDIVPNHSSSDHPWFQEALAAAPGSPERARYIFREGRGLDGLRRAASHLERAVADGTDREARWNMMMAAMEGALAFQKGMGAVHALSHPLGALQLHHGTLNAVLIPSVLRHNVDHLKDKIPALRAALGLPADADVADWFAALNRRIGMPANLSEMGVPRDRLDAVAEEAMTDSSHPSNPRPMTPEAYRAVLDAAF